MKKSVKWRVFA